MVYILIVFALLFCAVQAVRAPRLLLSALWLAGTSALTALLMYMLGAAEVAVIELSVGAGLVTVLFVFAINIAGEESLDLLPVIPRPFAWLLVVGAGTLLIWMNLGALGRMIEISAATGFAAMVWNDRVLDIYLQIILVYAGVLGVLGLLEESQHNPAASHPAVVVKEGSL
jgi:uncharacterized MnhB-related membrane protein